MKKKGLDPSVGGNARAEALPASKRSEIASKAARARWGAGDELPSAICGSPDKPLKIGEIEIPCYVLEDGRRMIVQRGLQTAIGMSMGGGKSGERKLSSLVASLAVNNESLKGLSARASSPILFNITLGGNLSASAHGYEATILPDICRAILAARRTGYLSGHHAHYAAAAEIILAGLANIGIIALVDEATGYEDVRAKRSLADILEKFMAKELRKWVKTFPLEFYKELYRVRGWNFDPESVARPGVVAHYTNDLIYSRLAPGVLDELKRKTPRLETGRLKHHMHRWLSDEIGHPKLSGHINTVIALLRANNSDSWEPFMRQMDRALPRFGATLEMPIE
jgi:hypothetical protein